MAKDYVKYTVEVYGKGPMWVVYARQVYDDGRRSSPVIVEVFAVKEDAQNLCDRLNEDDLR